MTARRKRRLFKAVILIICLTVALLMWRRARRSNNSSNQTTTNTSIETVTEATKVSTLDEAMNIALQMYTGFNESVRDYSGTLVSRERVGDQLFGYRMHVKIRNPHTEKDKKIPLSVYLKFLEPDKARDREVIYVADTKDSWLRAHESGVRKIATFELNPNGRWAMRDMRHPIMDTGILRLLEQLMENGKKARDCPPTELEVTLGERTVEGRACQSLKIVHKTRDHDFDFHIVNIDVDQQHLIPIHYEAFDWPGEPGGEPVLLESYTYLDLEFNVGLTDADFRCDNAAYDFPKRVIREGSLTFKSLGYLEKLFE